MKYGSPFEAFHCLAKIHVAQIKIVPASFLKPGACPIAAAAAAFFKVVSASPRVLGRQFHSGERGSSGDGYSKREAAGHVEINGGLPLSVGLRLVKAIWRSFSIKLGR